MNVIACHCKGGTCITYPTCNLFLELVGTNTGTYLYDVFQRSEFPSTLSFALTTSMSPIRRHCTLLACFPQEWTWHQDSSYGGLLVGEKGCGAHVS